MRDAGDASDADSGLIVFTPARESYTRTGVTSVTSVTPSLKVEEFA